MTRFHSHGRSTMRLAGIGALLLALLVSIVGPAPRLAFAASVITQWNFNSPTPDANTATGTTDPATGSGAASLVGGTTASFASGDASGGSSDPAVGDDSGWNLTTFAAQGTGNETRGAQFNVSTAGQENIEVRWDQRHSNTAARHVQFQYSTDGTSFTNFGAPFEATAGDTWFNGRSVNLSGVAGVSNNPSFAFRVVAAFAPGTTAYAASNPTSTYGTTGTWRFDMVTVSGDPVGSALPSVSLSLSTDTASEAAQTVVTVSATASEAVSGDQTVSLAVSGTGITAGDYTLSASTITIPDGTTSGSVTLTVVDDAEVEGTETATLTIADPSAGIVLGSPSSRTLTILDNDEVSAPVCEQPFTPIYAIQGSGASAAITGDVTTQGVVVGDYEGSTGLQGFYLQDAVGDGNPATSDGIFVFTGSANLVSAGQEVRVSGFARERFGETALNGSNSNSAAVPAANITICGTGSVAPTPVELPFASTTAAEQYEGMLITLPQTLVVAEYFNYDQFGEYRLALPLPGESRLYTPTSIELPGSPGYQARLDYNRRASILIDDGLGVSNPAVGNTLPNGQPFSLAGRFRGGDNVTGFTGVLGFGFSNYRVQPTTYGTFTQVNLPPAAPDPVGGRIKVAAFNALNYYLTPDYPSGDPRDNACGPEQDLECRGWDSDQPDELSRQRAKLLATLSGLDADVIGLIEIENTTGVEPMADIVAGLPGYAFVATGAIGTDAIKVGIIYRTRSVNPVGAPAILDTQAFVNPRGAEIDRNRPAVAQTFQEVGTGARFTVVVNHLKSKGSGCGAGDDDTTTGQGNCNETRRLAAVELARWLATDPTNSGDPDVLIIGDLNSYAKEAPIAALQSAGYSELIGELQGPLAYGYLFDAQFGYLDYAMSSASLTPQVTGITEWHINADEADLIDYDTTFKSPVQDSYYAPDQFRSSDHDPVLVGLNLVAPNQAPALAAIGTYDTGLGANGAEIISVRPDRAVLSNSIDASIDILDTSDPLNIRLIERVKIPELVGLTSVAIHPTKDLFVAVTGSSTPVRRGELLVFRLSDGALIARAPVGIDAASPEGRQPDAIEFAPDGSRAVIAIEAEQVSTSDDGGAGAIGVVDFTGFDPATSTSISVQTVELPDISGVPGVSSGRTHGDAVGAVITNAPGTIEPEGVAFAPDSSTVFVTLQENNAIARLSLTGALPGTLPVSEVFGLGQVNFLGDTVTSGGYNPVNLVDAFREPDGLDVVEINGTRYVVTADEGDTRNAAGSNSVRGGRTISIFNAATGALVADAGDQLSALANRYGLYPDDRSNRAAIEPEMLDVIAVNGRTIVAVGMERARSVAFVDISVPTAPLAFALVRTGDNPEGIKLLAQDDQLFVFVANEVSGTLTSATVPVLPLDATTTYTEDTPRPFGLGAVDFEGGDLTLTLTLSPATAGTLSGSGLVAGANPGEYTASGNTATLNATLVSLLFTPAPDFVGTVTLSASLSDGTTTTNGTLTFEGVAVNDAPVAQDDSFTTAEDTPVSGNVLDNDSDPDGDTLSATLTSMPANGTLDFNADGSFTYTPNANFFGMDGFTYTASDGSLTSNEATVMITVTPVNDAPTIVLVAGAAACATNSDNAGSLRFALGDAETEAGELQLSVSSSNSLFSTFVDGSGDNRQLTISVTPSNRVQTGTVTLTVTDAEGATATLTIQVTAGTNQNDVLTGNRSLTNVIFGRGGNDVITGGRLSDLLCGGNGNDVIRGGDGDDVIEGGNGNDVLEGQGGNDVIRGGDGNDSLLGGSGDDILTGGRGADLFDGGPGTDRATDFNPAEGDTRRSIEL